MECPLKKDKKMQAQLSLECSLESSWEIEAKSLGINVNTNPWMFNYKGLGWGYIPNTKDQAKFFNRNIDKYPNPSLRRWIMQTKVFKEALS